jgi:hypothetical protein
MAVAGWIITILHYCLVAYASAIMIWSFVKEKRWDREVLYVLVLLPFLLRLLRLK